MWNSGNDHWVIQEQKGEDMGLFFGQSTISIRRVLGCWLQKMMVTVPQVYIISEANSAREIIVHLTLRLGEVIERCGKVNQPKTRSIMIKGVL